MPFFVLLLLFFCSSLGLVRGFIKGIHIDGSDQTWRAADDRILFWHGTNFVEKSFPYYPEALVDPDSLSESISTMKHMGWNVVRLGVMIGGTFPTPDGALNSTYLDVIENIVENLAKSNVAVILDFHQDVFSPALCGEGVPSWMVNSSKLNCLPFPIPLVRSGSQPDPDTGGWVPEVSCTPPHNLGWSEWYGTDCCGKAFQQMYDGVGMISKMVQAHWQAIAERFKGKDGVLAYEMLNEPWNGDWISDPAILYKQGLAETKNVGPFMQMTHDTIRAVDPNTPTLYAPAELNNRLMRSVGYDSGFLPGEHGISCVLFNWN